MSYPFHVRSVLLAATGMSLDDNGHPPLPVELVEQILSYCDRHALLSCGAVCQTWLIITRPRIFGTLRVTRESSEPLSTLIGSPYSTPSTYTKSLYITYSTHATRNVELRWLEDLADKLLLFKQMYHLELNLPNAPSLDLRSITKALETLSPRVTSLSLRGSFDLEMQNIIPMVSACGSLRRLKLTQEGSYTRWSGLRSPLPSTLPMPQTIEHIQLELKSISMASSWMTWMQNNPKPRTPASFSTTTYAIGMQSVSEYLAKPTTASMVHLRLVSHPMSSGPFDLSHLPNLETLTLNHSGYPSAAASLITRSIDTLVFSSPKLHRISVGLFRRAPNENVRLASKEFVMLDSYLANLGARMMGLREVEVNAPFLPAQWGVVLPECASRPSCKVSFVSESYFSKWHT